MCRPFFCIGEIPSHHVERFHWTVLWPHPVLVHGAENTILAVIMVSCNLPATLRACLCQPFASERL